MTDIRLSNQARGGEISWRSASAIRQDVQAALRARSGLERQKVIALAAIEAKTDIVLGAMENLTVGTAHAARAVSQVRNVMDTLELLNPAISSDLGMLRLEHTMGMASLVGELEAIMRRQVKE